GRRQIRNVCDGGNGRIIDGFSRRRIDLTAKRALEDVGWLTWRLTPGEECLAIRAGEGQESLVGSFVRAEQALGLLAGEIELIEEWTVPFGRSTVAPEVDGVAFLDDDAGSVGKYAPHRIARVLVKLVGRKIPQQTRLLLGIIDVDDKRLSPALVMVVF